MTVYVKRMADFLTEPFAERIAVDERMETEPPRRKDQYEQDGDENQKANAFHANEIDDCGIELVSVRAADLPDYSVIWAGSQAELCWLKRVPCVAQSG